MMGYGPSQLRQRMECQFLPGMTWENYGKGGWHIDHKKPISAFIRQGIIEPRTVNMLSNLQPLWASDNFKKNSKWQPVRAANDNLDQKAA
jgi:hypothetical protein